MKKPAIATKILLTRVPYEMRQLGAETGTSEEWEAIVEDVMYAAMLRKFTQNPDLLEKLLATGDIRLVESTPDNRWGAGASITSKRMRNGEWKGENKQGILLMKARDKLRRERNK